MYQRNNSWSYHQEFIRLENWDNITVRVFSIYTQSINYGRHNKYEV